MLKFSDLIKKIDRDDYLVLILAVAFFVSRLLMFVLGSSINMNYLPTAWQNIDVWLFKTELFKSIWYLHSQPPFFNLFTGIGLKLFPIHFSLFFEIVFHLLGFTLALCLYYIIKNLSSNRLLAFVFSLVFVLSPSVILFENFFFYDFPVLVILAIIAFFFQKFTDTNKTVYLFAFFSTAAFLVLTRRIFHLAWFLVFIGVLLYFYRTSWKRIVLTMSIPLLLIIFWYGKNLYYFGNFDASSWTGMGFFKTATYALSQEERQKLFDEGIVSSHIFYGSDPFQIPIDTSTAYKIDKQLLMVPVVGDYAKKNGGINYNYYAYIDLSRQLKEEFISILMHRPSAYVKGVMFAGTIFFAPASNYFASSDPNNTSYLNYELVKKLDVFFNRFIYGQPLAWGGEKFRNYLTEYLNIRSTQAWRLLSPGIFLIIMHLVSIFYGLKVMFQKNAISVYGRTFYLTVVFLVINILYVSAVGTLAEIGENQRHRFMIEPLVWILFALFIQDVFFKKRHKL